VKYHP